MQIKYQFKRKNNPHNSTVFFVHGRGGNISVMDIFLRLIPEEFNVISLEAPLADPVVGGFSWWRVDLGEKRPDYLNLIELKIEEIINEYTLNKEEIHGMGFSQGGALLSGLVQKKDNLFKSVVMLASFVIKLDEYHGVELKNTEFLLINGNLDEVITKEKADRSFQYLIENNYKAEQIFEEVGHKLGKNGGKFVKIWFEKYIIT